MDNDMATIEKSKGLSIYQRLAACAEKYPERIAVVVGDQELTYSGLMQNIGHFAGMLRNKGCKPGDTIVVLYPNSLDFIYAVFAAFSLNGVVVPLNPKFRENELCHYLEISEPKAICGTQKTLSFIQENIRTDCQIFIEAIDNGFIGGENHKESRYELDAPALYMFSSGSTGKPKRVTRTQRQILAEYDSLRATVNISEADCILCTIPLYHAHGFGNAMFAALLSGAKLVLLVDEFNPRQTIKKMEEHGVTMFPAVPFMYKMLAGTRFTQAPNLNHLRLLISAGAALPAEVAEDFYAAFNKAISQLYGSTETGAITLNAEQPLKKATSVGKPLHGIEISIRDEKGVQMDPGGIGEIWIKSPAMAACYDGMADLSHEHFIEGWFFAGDLGSLDDEGYLSVNGRKKLLLNVAGNKVDPLEVEDVLRRQGQIMDIVVIGVPHVHYGEMVKAFVVLRPETVCTEQDIVKFAAEHLAEYKVPKQIEFIEEIPKSPLGKILRKYLQ